MFLEREGRSWSVDDLLAALGNPHDREILALAQARPMDAQQIREITGFPKSTVYRRLNELQEAGLLIPCSGIVRNGHAVERYRARLGRVSVALHDGNLEVTWEPLDTVLDDRATAQATPGRPVPPPIRLEAATEAPELAGSFETGADA